MTFRIEEKIRISPSQESNLRQYLLNKGALKLYAMRKIESVYFDNTSRSCYWDSEEGVLPRKKIRLRRYPDQYLNKWALEIKVSSVEGRFKISKPISADQSDNYFKNGILDRQYGWVMPVITIQYCREYFMLGEDRITFDNIIKYNSYPKSIRRDLNGMSVVEIKAAYGSDLDRLTNAIVGERSRFSKYCLCMINYL